MKRILIGAAVLLGLAQAAAAQEPDPSASYRTIKTAHFRVSYTPELTHIAQAAADAAEEAYELLQKQLINPPKGRIDLLLNDESDLTNGYATPLYSNRIVIFVKPPVDDIELQYFDDWLDLVITHELAHIFHLDRAGLVGRALRTIFGRVPFTWPIFPIADMPGWTIEGLATEFESRGTGLGRQHGNYHEMVVRTAVLEDDFDPIDRVSGDTPLWPGGQRAYIYGSLFNDYLARKHGAQAQNQIVRKTAGSILPPSWNANQIGKRALGTSFTTEYVLWRTELEQRYRAQADSLRAAGLSATDLVTRGGRYAQHPRISPDGKRLVFAEDNGRDIAHTRVIELDSGRTVWRERRNGIGPSDWLPDGSLITAQYDFTSAYALRNDLYRVNDQSSTRLTRAARLQEPDANRAGDRIVAVELGQGSSRLVLLDANGNLVRALSTNSQGTGWSLPRWSPDGTRIAVSRWQQGGLYDVVVIDTTGRVLQELSNDRAVDAAPAWSPDGRYIVFSSDRTGITNLYAYDLQDSRLRQITNLLTGAFHPEVSPDARHVYFAGYHSDGYHIERVAFDPSSWREPGAIRLPSAQRPRADLDSAAAIKVKAAPAPPQGYSAWPTLRPHYWLPFGSSGAVMGDFLGVSTSGADLIQRHSYGLSYAREFEKKRDEGYLAYSYAGAGNPIFNFSFSRDWDELGKANLIRRNPPDTSVVELLEREDVIGLSTTFTKPRIRGSTALSVGVELVRRRLLAADTPGVVFLDPVDFTYGPVASLGFANYRTPAYAISREDGVALQLSGRWRHENEVVATSEAGYKELTTRNAAYKSLGTLGFAHHVLAARVSALWRDGPGAPFTRIGGVPGQLFDVGFSSLGSSAGLLPVRGYNDSRRGTSGWSASLEYRLPVAMVGRGYKLWPVFLDRVHASAFTDAGQAYCTAAQQLRVNSCMPEGSDPLISVGAELAADISLLSFFSTRVRIGAAQPLTLGGNVRPYITFGSAF